jgi:hypothetical protein
VSKLNFLSGKDRRHLQRRISQAWNEIRIKNGASKYLSNFISDESGSLSILISGLFLLLLTLSIGIIDVSDSYIAKHELVQISESAISVAAHALDESRYYEEGIANSTGLVPIDCAKANSVFRAEIAGNLLRGSAIDIDSISCDGDLLTASVKSAIRPLVLFPLLNQITGSEVTIKATVGAASTTK